MGDGVVPLSQLMISLLIITACVVASLALGLAAYEQILDTEFEIPE